MRQLLAPRVVVRGAIVILLLIIAGGLPPGPATAAGGDTSVVADLLNSVGKYTSLALDSAGNPVVSYFADGSADDLKLLHCGNPNCTAGNSITSPDTAGDVGRYTSMALDADGNPVVSYYDQTNSDLKVLHCGNPDCTAGNSIASPDTMGVVGEDTSMALDAAGNPVVSYYDLTNGDLKVLHCGDPNCVSGNSITSPDTAGGVGEYSSLELDSAGRPVVSYFDATNGDLKVLHCGNSACTVGNSITSPATSNTTGIYTSLELDSDGYPVVSYVSATGGASLKMLHCGDPNCTSGNVNTSIGCFPCGWGNSLTLDANGFPVVSYEDRAYDRLRILHCGDATCTSGNSTTSPDQDDLGGSHSSLALDAMGNPVVSYLGFATPASGSAYHLKILHCGDGSCTGQKAPTPDHKVLFINGIGTQSSCETGFAGEVEWMTLLLSGQTPGYEWADEFVGIDSPDDFLYYDYTSGSDATETCPNYEPKDTCWSLNDYYNNMFLGDFGQTRRLANYIDTILANPTVTLTLVGFSQGGVLAAAAVDSYIGEPNLSRINAVVTFDSPLQGIPDWAEWVYQGLIADCDANEFDSPWDMEDDSDYIRAIVNEPHPDVSLFTIDRVGTDLNVPVPDRFSRVPTWEGNEGHIRIDTAPKDESHTWKKEVPGFENAGELRRMQLFLICAASPLTICETMASVDVGTFILTDRALTFGARPVAFSVGTTTQGFGVPVDTSVLTTLVLGDPSYSVALVSPSAVLIDEFTTDPDVTVQVPGGAWFFEIASPEVGQWQVKSTAPDLGSLAILSVTTPSSTADQDGDGTRDSADNCVGLSNPGQADTDGNGLGDACDADDDGDGVLDVADNCPDLPNAAQTDTDGNGRGDVCDLGGYQDWDSDGVVDNNDNCPIDVNTDQLNTDDGYLGDACDPDDDGDGCTDVAELGPSETLGGLRDPLNPWDYYDVATGGGAPGQDGRIDLFNDIDQVIQHYAPNGVEAEYDIRFDRGPATGSYAWNMTAPDGKIDLFNDIAGVINQFGHNCLGE